MPLPNKMSRPASSPIQNEKRVMTNCIDETNMLIRSSVNPAGMFCSRNVSVNHRYIRPALLAGRRIIPPVIRIGIPNQRRNECQERIADKMIMSSAKMGMTALMRKKLRSVCSHSKG